MLSGKLTFAVATLLGLTTNIGKVNAIRDASAVTPSDCQVWFDGCNTCKRVDLLSEVKGKDEDKSDKSDKTKDSETKEVVKTKVGTVPVPVEWACSKKLCKRESRLKPAECLKAPPKTKPSDSVEKDETTFTKASPLKSPPGCVAWDDNCNTCTLDLSTREWTCTEALCPAGTIYPDPSCTQFDAQIQPQAVDSNCLIWFDGCITYQRREITDDYRSIPRTCVKKELKETEEAGVQGWPAAKCVSRGKVESTTPPSGVTENCEVWFDGCNTCRKIKKVKKPTDEVTIMPVEPGTTETEDKKDTQDEKRPPKEAPEFETIWSCNQNTCSVTKDAKCIKEEKIKKDEEPKIIDIIIDDIVDDFIDKDREDPEFIKKNCLNYFDGCNWCRRKTLEDKYACTRKFCLRKSKPMCGLFGVFESDDSDKPTPPKDGSAITPEIAKLLETCLSYTDGCNKFYRDFLYEPFVGTKLQCSSRIKLEIKCTDDPTTKEPITETPAEVTMPDIDDPIVTDCQYWFNGCEVCKRPERNMAFECPGLKCYLKPGDKLKESKCVEKFDDSWKDDGFLIIDDKDSFGIDDDPTITDPDNKPVPPPPKNKEEEKQQDEEKAKTIDRSDCLVFFNGCYDECRKSVKKQFVPCRKSDKDKICTADKMPECKRQALFGASDVVFDKEKEDKNDEDRKKKKEKEEEIPAEELYTMEEQSPVGVDGTEPPLGCKVWFNGCKPALFKKKENKWKENAKNKKKCRKDDIIKESKCLKFDKKRTPRPSCAAWFDGCNICERDFITKKYLCQTKICTKDELRKPKCLAKVDTQEGKLTIGKKGKKLKKKEDREIDESEEVDQPDKAMRYCVNWFDGCDTFTRDKWYQDWTSTTNTCATYGKQFCQIGDSPDLRPPPGCKKYKTQCATCELDPSAWEWFCDIDTSCQATTDDYGYCELEIGDPDDTESATFDELIDAPETITTDSEAGKFTCEFSVKGTEYTETCSETKEKTVVRGYMPDGKPIVGTTIECSSTKKTGTINGVTAEEIDMTQITSYQTTGETTTSFECGADPDLKEDDGSGSSSGSGSTTLTDDDKTFVRENDVKAKEPTIIEDYIVIVDESVQNAVSNSTAEFKKDQDYMDQQVDDTSEIWFQALDLEAELQFKRDNFRPKDDLFASCWVRIGDVHFGCTDDRTEWNEDEQTDEYKYTVDNVDQMIRDELDASLADEDIYADAEDFDYYAEETTPA